MSRAAADPERLPHHKVASAMRLGNGESLPTISDKA